MRNIVLGTVAAASLIAYATPSHATLQIAWDFGGVTGGCVDNSGCDLSPLVGRLELSDQLINGVEVNGSIQTSTKSAGLTILNTSSLSVINTNGTPILATVTVGDTSFIGPVNRHYLLNIVTLATKIWRPEE